MADKILNSFDVWVGAQGWKSKLRLRNVDNISLDGIARLRELILDLAVRGNLVSQVPTDEPANLLLEKIKAERYRLAGGDKQKKEETLTEKNDGEKLFDLPKGWIFVRFSDLILDAYTGLDKGKSLQSLDFKYPYFKMNNILNEGGFDLSEMTHVDASATEVQKYSLSNNDFLFNTRNSRELVGKTCVIKGLNDEKIIYNNNILRVKFSQVSPDFIDVWFRCKTGKSLLDKIKSNTTNVCAIYQGKLFDFLCVVPPLAEQHRIVAKVDELMTLCDELEQQETNHLKSHQLLVETLLGTLTQAKDAAEFQTAWATLAQHFDDLFNTEDSIDQLKQTILQLAVMGKLVPQDPKDESASVLLERIAKEKKILIEEGKIGNEALLSIINEDEKPFTLPKGWDWTRLGTVTDITAGASFKSEDFNSSGGIKCIKITNAGVGEFIETDDYLPESFIKKFSDYLVNEGDLVLALTRPYISDGLKISICPSSYHRSLLNQRVAAIRSITKSLHHPYTFTFIRSPHVLKYYKSKFDEKSQQPNMKMGDITNLAFAICPLNEQIRIVDKIDELFALCDSLNERITESQKVANQMADSILAQVV